LSLDKAGIAARLRQAGAMLRFRGESLHRARAYERGAETVETFSGDLQRLASEGRLTELPGIGRSLAATITELLQEGQSATLERISGDLPGPLAELVNVRGFTPRRIQLFHDRLDVATVEDIRGALASGAAAQVKGIGPAVAGKLLAALDRSAGPRQTLLPEAARLAAQLLSHLRSEPSVIQSSVAGAVRRCVEVVGELNLVAASARPEEVVARFQRHPAVAALVQRNGADCTVRLRQGLAATLTVAAPSTFGAALMGATGAAAHVDQLGQRAGALGLALGQIPGATESDVYRTLGLCFIPPELREGRGEIAAAAAGDTFADLVTDQDLRGAVHCHSVHSDGNATIAEMAAGAARLGLSYLTVTDHSPAAAYAGGLSAEALRQQGREIDQLQGQVPLLLLRGAECDILADGSLDHGEDVRDELDVVIASIHERHKMDAAAMTTRLARALGHRRFKIWGHPLGRLLLRRPPIACDFEAILDVLAGSPSAIEVNGSPYRLDLPAELIPAARRRGIKFVISADAHSVAEFGNLRSGVAVARRGGLRRSDVLNTLPAEEFVRVTRSRG
jgi:DNA polymerase (family 10)